MDPTTGGESSISLEENHKKTLGTIVHEPVRVSKWIIFCLEQDIQTYGIWLYQKMAELSKTFGTGITVEEPYYVALPNHSKPHDFIKEINDNYVNYIVPDLQGQSREAHITKKDQYFCIVLIPFKARKDEFYKEVKDKINLQSPVITQFI